MTSQYATVLRQANRLVNLLQSSHRFQQHFIKLSQACCASLLVGMISTANAQALAQGSFIGWGLNSYGETALPSVTPPITNISAISSSSGNTVALRSDGTVLAWGRPGGPVVPPPGLNDATAVAASNGFMMALRRNGTVVFWGSFPQAGPFLPGYLTDIVAISASPVHALALKRDGTVIDWKVSDGSLLNVPAGVEGVTAIAAGYLHGLALKNDGTLVGWDNLGNSNLNINSGLEKFVAVAATNENSLALKGDGSVTVWGIDTRGLVSGAVGLTNIKAIAASEYHALALTSDGVVKAWGSNFAGQATVPEGITNVKAIAAGTFNSFALNPAPLINPYTFSGFQRPVDGEPVINIGKAGRTYPVKWQLTDQNGSFVSALTAVKSVTLAPVLCGNFDSAPGDAIEIETTGETMLRYDAETNQFVYNWKTPRNPLCYKLFLTLDTNQVFTAKFNLSK